MSEQTAERGRSDGAPTVLDLGCDNNKLEGAVGVDQNPDSAADIQHDLDQRPWPLPSDTFEHVRALDVFEHVEDLVACMEEVHRVCAPDATVFIRMPFMTSVHFATDPTHRRAATSRTFDYFDPTRPLGRYGYSSARFEVLSVHYERGYPNNLLGRSLQRLDRGLMPWIHRHREEYEHFFAGVYPMHNVCFRLRVAK